MPFYTLERLYLFVGVFGVVSNEIPDLHERSAGALVMKQKQCLLALMVIALTGCQADQAPEDKPAMPVSRGQELFLTHCVSCHQGAGNPPEPNAVVINSSRLKTEADFIELLRHPSSAMMRSFSEQELNAADGHDLYVYLHKFQTPATTNQ